MAVPGGPASIKAARAPRWYSLEILLLLINVGLYAAAFQVQSPVQPALVKSLSAESADANAVIRNFALLKSWAGILQVVGSLLAGWLVDRVGCKWVLLASFISSAACYALTAVATDMSGLYLALLPTVFQHAVLAARAWVAIHADGAPELISYVGVAYGLGFIVGPAVGGQLSKFSLQTPSIVAAVLSVLSVLLVGGLLDNKRAPAAPAIVDKSPIHHPTGAGGLTTSPLRGSLVTRVLGSKLQTSLLLIKLLFSAAISILNSVFSLVAADRFGLDAAAIGFLLSFVGGVGLVSQAVLVGWVARNVSDRTLTYGSAVILAACFACFTTISTPLELYVLCVPLTVVGTVYGMANTAQIARLAAPELKGTIVALDMALGSFTRMVAPALTGYLLTTHGYASVGAASSALVGLVPLLLLVSCCVLR